MALINTNSPEATVSNLDLFTVPATQTAIVKSNYIDYYPVSELSGDAAPLEFNISGAGADYISLRDTLLYLKVKIVKSDNSNLTKENKVGFVNLPLQSMFSQIDVSLNQKLVSSANNNYMYKAYISKLLNFGTESKTTQLTSELFFKDRAGFMNDPNTLTGSNTGLLYRAEYTALSQSVDLMGHLQIDAFQTDRFLLNGVELRLKFYRNKPDFVLMSGDENANYKIIIEQAILKICKVEVNPSVTLAHAQALKNKRAIYPIKKIDMKTVSIASGSRHIDIDDAFLGNIPEKIILCLINSESYNGSYVKNPFDFANYDINHIGLFVNGESQPARPLRLTFNDKAKVGANYIDAFENIYLSTDKLGQDSGSDISRSDFPGGYALFLFNLNRISNQSGFWNLIKNGNLRIEIQFSKALSETVNLLIYGEFSNCIEIDETKNIYLSSL